MSSEELRQWLRDKYGNSYTLMFHEGEGDVEGRTKVVCVLTVTTTRENSVTVTGQCEDSQPNVARDAALSYACKRMQDTAPGIYVPST